MTNFIFQMVKLVVSGAPSLSYACVVGMNLILYSVSLAISRDLVAVELVRGMESQCHELTGTDRLCLNFYLL